MLAWSAAAVRVVSDCLVVAEVLGIDRRFVVKVIELAVVAVVLSVVASVLVTVLVVVAVSAVLVEI